jgi:hypothetical protein
LGLVLWKRAVASGWRPRHIGHPLLLLRARRKEHDILLLLPPVRARRLPPALVLLPILPLAPALPLAHPLLPPLPHRQDRP